ncbi:MAG: hypothetical protein CVU81_01400 [Euryarchaeota archaeon HGW-Euryarchaeota-1]|nr:MAG: hypothetical protein CVU81_01400 [Euryarchaeota archaeon HGW-Euryarchaeota-1]
MADDKMIDSEKLKAVLQAHKINASKRLVEEIDKNPDLRQKIIVVFGMGSWVRDPQSKSNDWDIVCILDDSGDDATKVPIAFVLDHLRSSIQQLAWGVDQRFHIQCYALTSLVSGVIQAFPTMYSYVRDGVPFKDVKGIFVTLKQMIDTSKIKPTYDTIETEQRAARARINNIRDKILNEILFELQYAAADISQAVSAAWGYEIPDPARIEGILEEMKAQGVIEQKYINTWVDIRKKWKDVEHKVCFDVSPQELGEYERKVREYIDYMESKIVGGQRNKQKQDTSKYISQLKDQIKQILNLLNVDYTDENAIAVFEKEAVGKKMISPQVISILYQLLSIQENFDKRREVSETEIRELLKKLSNIAESVISKDALLQRIKNAKDVKKIDFVAKNSVVVNMSELLN